MIFEVREKLLEHSEENYRKFTEKLIPGAENILGVRTPFLKETAKKIAASPEWKEYVLCDEMKYYEEIMLQGMVIGIAKEKFDEKIKLAEKFIPKINNWAVCDNFCSNFKAAKNNREKMWGFLEKYFLSEKEYEIRFVLIMCLKYFITDEYLEKIFEKLDFLEERKYYYVQMGIAWTAAEIFIKYPERALEYLKNNKLDKFTYNKSIQKICESLRVEKSTKEYLKTLKRK